MCKTSFLPIDEIQRGTTTSVLISMLQSSSLTMTSLGLFLNRYSYFMNLRLIVMKEYLLYTRGIPVVYPREKVTASLRYKKYKLSFYLRTVEIGCEKERRINRNLQKFTLYWDRYIQSLASSCFFHGRLIQGCLITREPSAPGLALKTAWLLTDCSLCWLTADSSGL